ncbi:MAG: hypothetical protein E7425_11210 [Ruminococcaceae bacterium]|jgi:hypothetical protein|nr:hypothetical protein [Oscillospiraceae bacterium]
MDLNATRQFMKDLEHRLNALGMETTYSEGSGSPQIGDTLCVLFPLTEKGHPTNLGIMVSESTAEQDLLILYTTLIAELNEKADELSGKLRQWSATCPLGEYGIFDDEEEGVRQLYNQYVVNFPVNMDPAELAEKTMQVLERLHKVLSDKYPELEPYMAG